MAEKSFYNLDYIIEINEKRHEEYTSAYQKVLERFTNLILIYSAITIFLIPLTQFIFVDFKGWFLCICFLLFALLFLTSLFFTVRLIIPVEVAYLEIPKKYYDEYRLRYEQTVPDQNQRIELLKASYITELETAVNTNERVFRKKSSFYYNALMFVLLSTIPYLICLSIHIAIKKEDPQKIEIVNPIKVSTFMKQKDSIMAKNNSNSGTSTSGSSTATSNSTTTHLPIANGSQVITSTPNLIKENSSEVSKR